ncbi:hypothetical protein ABZ622_08625 [Streptomyces sp. NPDC007164]
MVSTAWRPALERSPLIRLGDAEPAEALYAQPAEVPGVPVIGRQPVARS